MKTYHKIRSIFKRDIFSKNKKLIIGDYSLPEFEYLRNLQWVCTEKVDGTNIRVSTLDGTLVSIGGRTENSEIPKLLREELLRVFDIDTALVFNTAFSDSHCTIYGEGYGEKIQSGGKYCKGNKFVVFDIMVGDVFLERHNVECICDELTLEIAPEVFTGTLDEAVEVIQANPESTWGNFTMEGFVARPIIEIRTRTGGRIITKIKCKDFE